MSENRVLYEINVLEKMIAREFFGSGDDIRKNMTPSQLQIMDYLLNHQGKSVYQKDLEEVLKLRRATVSGILHTMEKNGLIKRIICDNDARSKMIIFNDSIKECFEAGKRKFLEIDSVIKEGISDEEIMEFKNTLQKMQKNIIKYRENK